MIVGGPNLIKMLRAAVRAHYCVARSGDPAHKSGVERKGTDMRSQGGGTPQCAESGHQMRHEPG